MSRYRRRSHLLLRKKIVCYFISAERPVCRFIKLCVPTYLGRRRALREPKTKAEVRILCCPVRNLSFTLQRCVTEFRSRQHLSSTRQAGCPLYRWKTTCIFQMYDRRRCLGNTPGRGRDELDNAIACRSPGIRQERHCSEAKTAGYHQQRSGELLSSTVWLYLTFVIFSLLVWPINVIIWRPSLMFFFCPVFRLHQLM